MRCPFIRLVMVWCLLCWTALPTVASKPSGEPRPPKQLTVDQAAQAVIEACRAKDQETLKTLAQKDEPDPWMVADELLHRAEADAALGFARAAPRKDTESLPTYVARNRDTAPDASAREALGRATAARAQGDAAVALAAVGEVSGSPHTVIGVRRLHVKGWVLRHLGRVEESASTFLAAARAAEALGWWNQAAVLLHEGGASATQRADYRAALSAWQRRLAIEEARGDRARAAGALANVANAHTQLGEYPQARPLLERVVIEMEALGVRSSVAMAIESLGAVHMRTGRYQDARSQFERALAMSERLGDRTGMARALHWLGCIHRARGEYVKALSCMEPALSVMEALGNRLGVAYMLADLGNLHRVLGDYRRALRYLERSLALGEDLGNRTGIARALGSIGLLHQRQGEYASALSAYERSLALEDASGNKAGVAVVLSNIGILHNLRGDYVKALTTQRRALSMQEALGDRAGVALVLANIGTVHKVLGDYPKALTCYERALALSEALEDRDNVALILGNIGLIHDAFGDYPKAFSYYERSLAQKRELGDGRGVAETLGNIGIVHARLGNYPKAISYCGQALQQMEAGGYRSGVASTLGNLGAIHQSLGDDAQALTYYESALEVQEAIGTRAGVATILTNLGVVHLRLGNHAKALSYQRRALALSEELGDRAEVTYALVNLGVHYHRLGDPTQAQRLLGRGVREARRLRDRSLLASGLTGLALVRLTSGESGRAFLTAQQALTEVESLLRGLAEEEGATAREQFAMLFGVGVLAAVRLEEPAEALAFLESGRAGSLLETLGGGQAVRFAHLPEALVRAEAEAMAEEARARREHERARASGKRRSIRKAARAVDEAMELRREVAARIQREAKHVAGVFYPRAATLEELQGWLPEDTTLVLYGLCLDEALALVLEPEDARFVALGTAEQVEAACRAVACDDPDGNPTAAITALRELLIDPLALNDDTESVLISPTGALGYLPWSALVDRPVACQPSGTTWKLLLEEEHERGTKILALGDPAYEARPGDRSVAVYERGAGLVPLPATREEAMTIGDVVLLGEDASESGLSKVLAKERRWRAVHLACHGLVDAERPTLSSLALSPGGEEDGFLTCLEVFRMDIPADLAVLSACETAKGKIVKAEGIVGLTRAFMYAGAPRVLCSLWKVDDEATQALMIRFYELWNPKEGEGLGAAAALEKAQEYVRDHPDHPEWRHPYYWAAWVLWGLPD